MRLGQKETHVAKGQIQRPKGPNKYGNNVSDPYCYVTQA